MANSSNRDLRELAPMDILHQRITLDLTLGQHHRRGLHHHAVPREGVMSIIASTWRP